MTKDFKIYIVNFFAAGVNLPAFHQYLNDSVEILGYWNHIPLVYCLKSHLDATSLRDRLRPFLPNPLLIVEINPANMNGFMFDQKMWTWFFEPAPEKKPSLPASMLRDITPPQPFPLPGHWPQKN